MIIEVYCELQTFSVIIIFSPTRISTLMISWIEMQACLAPLVPYIIRELNAQHRIVRELNLMDDPLGDELLCSKHSLDSVYAPNYCWKIYWCKFLWRISIKLKNLLGKSKIKLSTCFDWVLNPIETFTVQSYFKNIEKQVFEISLQSFKVLDQSKIQILMLSKLTIMWPFV